MLKLIGFLWSGCWHKWVTDKRVNVVEYEDAKLPVGVSVFCHCDKCGAHRIFRMRN